MKTEFPTKLLMNNPLLLDTTLLLRSRDLWSPTWLYYGHSYLRSSPEIPVPSRLLILVKY
jgi:hypothetical protein